ncbi:MAG TPA: YbaB/EbfC family nucleoid-associated protein [Candidatus Bathyarchaeia archaeon]|nr:YbaB/EbfC family nucleoid-associated protein [Candidatus Bathyarchaeia archaeon]
MANPFDLSSMGDLMKQAKAMQDRLASLQAEVGARVVEASAGGGMVTARVNGKLELLSLAIEAEVFKGEDREMLQDLVVAAVNGAIRKAQQMMSDEMAKLTGGLRIPGLT